MRYRIVRSFVLLAMVLAATHAVTSAAATGWTSVRSKNFLLSGDTSEVQLKNVASRLEQFRDALSQILPGLRFDLGVRTNVIVFKDTAAYRAFKPKRPDGTPDDAVAGYFLSGGDVNYITLSTGLDRGDPYRTIFHEYVHFLLRSNFGDGIPPWVDEGIAQYFESLQVIDPNHVAVGGTTDAHLSVLKQNSLIPLKTLLSMDSSTLHGGGDDPRNLFYAQSWALIHLLMHRDGIASVISLAADPNIRKTFGSDPQPLERELGAYIQRPNLPVADIELKRPVAARSDLVASTVSDAQANAYIGDLLYHADRLGEAEPYLRKAVALDPGSALGHMSLGLLLMRSHNFSEARKHLELGIDRDMTNHLAYFNYAYAISRESEGPDGTIDGYSDEDAAKIRAALLRAIELEPRFAESYRLLAFLHYVNDENLDEASTLVKKGLALRPSDQDFEILLAKIELAQEKYSDAKDLAVKLSNPGYDPKIRNDAEDILKAIGQYTKARLEVSEQASERLPWTQPLIFLKRSWLTDSDLAKIDRDREINNLNRALGRPLADEKQILGTIDRVSCSESTVTYSVSSEGKRLIFTSDGFQKLRMAVLLEGDHSFQIDCGISFSQYLTVLDFRPAADKRPASRPQLTAITFVPNYFILKNAAELASIRMVVVEDDLLRRGRNADTTERVNPGGSKPEARWASISDNLRRPQTGETRRMGTLERIDCRGDGLIVTARLGDEESELHSDLPKDIKVSWFGAEASQIPLVCGNSPMMPNTIFTFVPNSSVSGMLKAIEFVPAGFSLPSKN